MTPRTKSALLLLALTMVWGLTFPMNRWGLTTVGMDPFAFGGIRFLLAAVAFLPLAIRGSRRLPETPGGGPPDRFLWLKAGLATGSVLAIYGILQYVGLVYTTSGKSGFISGLYVVIVPLMAMFAGRRPGLPVWGGLCLAVIGLWLLSNPGGEGTFNVGDVLTLVSAVFTAVHVILTASFANRVDSVRFVTVQLALTGFASLGIAVFTGNLPSAPAFWGLLPICMFGIISLAGGILIQTSAQKHMRSYEVALMLQLQGAFAALFGMIFLKEIMTLAMWGGAVLVVAGAALSQKTSRKRVDLPHGQSSGVPVADKLSLEKPGSGEPSPEKPVAGEPGPEP
ncbi:MAG: DMT family transporter [Deltaproteobacteria bacterium]|jgi:drug/metabolite transporter (DMT)-like permease|nr:DMT family transporter [Deltaproteobacteria bacterium]